MLLLLQDKQRYRMLLILARSGVKMLKCIFSCCARLLERLVSQKGFSFRMKKTHGSSSPNCHVAAESHKVRYSSVIQNFRRDLAEAMEVLLLAFIEQLPGHCAIHQRQYTFLLNPAVIPFSLSCFKCFSNDKISKLLSEEMELMLLILNMPGLYFQVHPTSSPTPRFITVFLLVVLF